jgi:hypothetical protein
MPTIRGRVEYVKVGDDYGFVQIQEVGTGDLEIFIIWFSDSGPGGPAGFWTLQLMTALAQRLQVEIFHQPSSAYIQEVKVTRTAAP